ncbi:MAG: AMP-binding protein [Crocinitomicaceae bacterium]|nr:AMP-binding protein [Crocinitomicaceae bacterium]
MINELIILDKVSDSYLQQVYDFIDLWNNDELTILVETSGSTGKPKVITLSKERIKASALATGEFFDLKEGETALLNLSPQYIAGKLMIVRAIVHEMNLIIAPLEQDPLLTLGDQQIDFAAFVPSQIEQILQHEKSVVKFNNMKNIIIGGAPLAADLENELVNFHPNIYASFGMTETITHFALRRLGTPYYKCLEGFTVSQDNRSCLVIHPNKVVEEILFTNDVINMSDPHTFKWLGRLDNVINSGGIKIHPEKAEKMVAHLISDNRFYITSKKDPTFGEVAVLVIEGEMDISGLLEDAKESLPKHHAPKEVIIEKQFEETPTHKIIRKKF